MANSIVRLDVEDSSFNQKIKNAASTFSEFGKSIASAGADALGKFVKGATSAKVAMEGFNAALKANAIGLVITAAVAAADALYKYMSGVYDAEEAQKQLNAEIANTKIQLSTMKDDADFDIAIARAAGKSADAIAAMRVEAAKARLALADLNFDKVTAIGSNASKEQIDEARSMQQKAEQELNAANRARTILTIQNLNKKPRGGGGGGRRGGGSANQQTEFQQNQTKINTLTQEYVKLGDQATDSARKRQEEIQKEIQALEKRNGLLKLREEQAHGKLNDVNVDMSVLSGSPSLDAWWKNRKNSSFTGLTKEGQKAIERQQKNFYKNLGKDGKEEKSFTQVADQMVGGISQMVGGLEKIGIELPEGFQSILSGISGVIEVLQAINIIVEAINAAQTVGTFLGIFAHGGVVPHAQSGLNVVGGTHYSGDVTPILANAGEVVLNNSQVQNLAHNLQNGGGQQSIRVYGIMRGKDIVLTSDNYLKSTGKGQFVTTKNRRN